jgi:hypothetical protein
MDYVSYRLRIRHGATRHSGFRHWGLRTRSGVGIWLFALLDKRVSVHSDSGDEPVPLGRSNSSAICGLFPPNRRCEHARTSLSLWRKSFGLRTKGKADFFVVATRSYRCGYCVVAPPRTLPFPPPSLPKHFRHRLLWVIPGSPLVRVVGGRFPHAVLLFSRSAEFGFDADRLLCQDARLTTAGYPSGLRERIANP